MKRTATATEPFQYMLTFLISGDNCGCTLRLARGDSIGELKHFVVRTYFTLLC